MTDKFSKMKLMKPMIPNLYVTALYSTVEYGTNKLTSVLLENIKIFFCLRQKNDDTSTKSQLLYFVGRIVLLKIQDSYVCLSVCKYKYSSVESLDAIIQ